MREKFSTDLGTPIDNSPDIKATDQAKPIAGSIPTLANKNNYYERHIDVKKITPKKQSLDSEARIFIFLTV